MTTWAGWISYFLSAVPAPDTAGNVTFLQTWAAHADHPGCAMNPIDLHAKNSGSRNCADTGFVNKAIQAYTLHTYARTAFYAQIQSGRYPHLVAALKSGDPYTYADWQALVGELADWPSDRFQNLYLAQRSAGAGPGVTATNAFSGWSDLRRSINHRMPSTLRDSHAAVKAGARAVARARKVRL